MGLSEYKQVEKIVSETALKAGRAREDITILAVSKTKPVEAIRELYEGGVRDFGENYVQELREKQEILPKDIRWHMIGHLQKNKAKYIAPYVYMIHSVDSLDLAKTIEKEAAKNDRVINVLVEVNVAQEETKFGVSAEEAVPFAQSLSQFPHVRFCGFMTSAPLTEDPETVRPVFRRLYDLSLDTALKNPNNEMGFALSMGMTNDYRVAIEEGSTIVRLGTCIFGARDYTKNGDSAV